MTVRSLTVAFLARTGLIGPARRFYRAVKVKKLTKKLSLIVPTYNVEPYIEQFLASVFAQTVRTTNLEVIIVDDGSTDRSGEIAKRWAARYPKTIKYIYQDNKGLSGARNTGLQHATGEWVSFPDPDDFLPPNYLEKVHSELVGKHRLPLLMVAVPLVFFRDETGKFEDQHPLKFKFRKRTVLCSGDLGDFIQLSVNSAWLPRELINHYGLQFDQHVRPTFEDAHLINKLLVLEPRRSVIYTPATKYFYRKRETSLVGGARERHAWYLDQLRYGYLDLLEWTNRRLGYVPYHVQCVVLYEAFWRFKHLVNHPERATFLTSTQREEFRHLLDQIFRYIDIRTIERFNIAEFHHEHCTGLLAMFKSARPRQPRAYFIAEDPFAGTVQIKYYSGSEPPSVTTLVNGVPAAQLQPSKKIARLFDEPFYIEHRYWVRATPDCTITVDFDGAPALLKTTTTSIGSSASVADVRSALVPTSPSPWSLPRRTAKLRNMSAQAAARQAYGNCWLFMDRDDAGDDNAEHLYRYLLKIGAAERAFFVLRADSKDWKRLAGEGFRLIAFGSDEHGVALLNADYLISSHADHFILWPFSRHGYSDLVHYQFIFLQHGVTKDDLSRWLNTKPIALFVTATAPEFRSIAGNDSGYCFSEKEVKLTGFPRHDALLASAAHPRTILIMPTWREFLTGGTLGAGMARSKMKGFEETMYARSWGAVLHSGRLHDIARRFDKEIVFCPHPNMAMYIDEFDVPDFVTVRDPRVPPSLQLSFAEAAALVTDYSSVAFEVAYLDRPIVYYQFDAEEFFVGDHVYQKGYFDYASDGFGPIVEDLRELLDKLEAALSGNEAEVYSQRRKSTFSFRDGRCCERVYEAILDLDSQHNSSDATILSLNGYRGDPGVLPEASVAMALRALTAAQPSRRSGAQDGQKGL